MPRARAFMRTAVATAVASALSGLLWAGAAEAAQPLTWNFAQAAIPPAQPLGNYGAGITVAVVDTWVDPADTEFKGRLVDEAYCVGAAANGGCKDHTYAPDSCVHGTHVAGTIASTDYGVAPLARILAVQVLSGPAGPPDPNAECTGSTSDVAAGIDLAVAKGARIINLSLAEQIPLVLQDASVTAAIQRAAQAGVVVVAAAGNSGLPVSDSYGSSALVVAATGPSGQLAGYSNFGRFINLAAPGGDSGGNACSAKTCVLSTFPHNATGLLQGTSMAAPHVAGVAALLLSQDPARGRNSVFSALESTATPVAGAGAGLIDAKAALEIEASSHPPSAATTLPSSATSTPPPSPRLSSTSGAPSGSGRPAPVPTTARQPAATAPAPSGSGASPGEPGGVPAARAALTPPTSAARTARPAVGPGPVALGPAAGASGRVRTGDWLGHHAAVLVVACVLLTADVLAAAWMREARRLFGRRA